LKKIVKDISAILSKREKNKLYRLALLDLIISVLDISFLVFLIYVVTFYTQLNSERLPLFLSYPIFKKFPLLLITAFFALYALKNYLAYAVYKHHHQFIYDVASRISKTALLHYLHADYFNYVEIDSSVHIRRISQEPIEFCHYVLRGVLQIINQLVLLVTTLAVVLIFNAQLFILLFVVLLPPIFMTGYKMKKRLANAKMNSKVASEKSLQHLQEALNGYIESNVDNKREFFVGRYHEYQQKLNDNLSLQQIIQNLPPRVIEVFAVFGLFALVLINTILTKSPSLHIIAIGTFVAAAYKIIPGIVKILNSVGQIKTYSFTCDSLIKYNRKPLTTFESSSRPLNSFELTDVCFKYKEAQVLKNFNLKVERGDFVGLSGMSGKGKTTVLNLLLGFLTPQQGAICINESVSDNDRRIYWNNMSYVKQHPFLINDTIISNIILADKYYDKERLGHVINITGVADLAFKNAGGLNAIITENGKNLSGGQRQRIALARALYKDFDLLILDEPFSELDDDSEKNILQYLQQISLQGKMIVLITHNKQSLQYCNKKVLMDA
jgi:ABC-type bacteriocin/lantibiotic exporter with double-glycine peptidase domain